ncbi:glycoside hydrolase family 16 protein [Amycolatopsis sp. K13G38]|uniref:Glycoside hydrolase family 16 protein n=1 Tax=Amycolatopsis acididurans TaxID=2724524 RepID=A0ABX1IZ75_9PSEU|nr:glycoside hydrolase family 16 protein [Amycolatopsis acididurans]NKQ52806.1 glycoside hydrolase family 16 protein [Amycolatopsis acididurans]
MKRRVILLSLCAVLVALAVVAVRLTADRFSGGTEDPPGQAAAGASPAPPVTSGSTEAAVRYGWKKIGGEEFDGASVDTAKWDVYNGDNSVNESWSKKQCAVADGVLTLTGQANNAGTTCGIAWKDDQTFGRWEVRARMPKPADRAFAPTFLLWGADDANFPDAGEIDFSETWNAERTFTDSWLHGPGNTKGPHFQSAPVDLTQWHNFGVDWQADKITLYLDGQVWGVYDDPKFIPKTPMHLVLQLTFVRNHPGELVQTTAQVDWARIYAP